jgi:hypothetical protein
VVIHDWREFSAFLAWRAAHPMTDEQRQMGLTYRGKDISDSHNDVYFEGGRRVDWNGRGADHGLFDGEV